ncbi:cilia- and flagella-associated protein 65-like [Cimex lectularius]|uniref:Cilia- and flagella-associated protein 65 n=1 Tax=Cimex lectularius TaxID=79782 RepID=A0A8I6RNT7_CIMLE|nr:cilia- and flagella-associated protein 65-like [Cimex lectularius]
MSTNENIVQYRKVDFGTVIPGCIYTRKVKVKSRFKLPFVGNLIVHPLNDVYITIKSTKPEDESENTYIITFAPILPHHIYTAYQYLFGVEENAQEALCLQGATTGPTVELKPKKLTFFTYDSFPVRSYLIEMKNTSKCLETFMWDYDGNQSEIVFQPSRGVIRGGEVLKFVVTFTPRRYGLYFRWMFCLLSMHEPLMIEISCLHVKKQIKTNLKNFITYAQPFPAFPTMYCRYVNDIAKKTAPESKPLITLSHRYLDLGCVWLDGNETNKLQDLQITSYLYTEVQIVWDTDQAGIFSIKPKHALLQRTGKFTFSVEFKPKHPEMLYSAELHGSILWGSGFEFIVPLPLTVNLIGNSFPPNSCSWEPFININKRKVVVPTTIPGVPTYTSFMIQKTNDLPIQFKVYPTDKKIISQFVVKPRKGIMLEETQIFIVQMFPGDKTDEPCLENWTLLLNLVHTIPLQFCGTVEKPFLKVGKDKDIVFPITQLKVENTRCIPIKNPTCLHLKYRCKENKLPNTFLYNKDIHTIGPGEEQLMDFTFRPTELGQFQCTVSVEIELWNRDYPDPRKEARTETILYLIGLSEKADITCLPDYLLIDDVLKTMYGEERFKLINNSRSTSCVLLECLPRAIGSHAGLTEFIPNNIVLAPHDSIMVTVRCRGDYVGLQTLKIVYTIYTSQEFNVKSTGEQIFLLALDFCCTFPMLRIMDIRYKTMCKCLPKIEVWSMLMINKLNEQLSKAYLHRDQKAYMKFPEDSNETPFFVVQMLIKNISPVPTHLEVGYIKSCECNDDRVAQRKGSKFSYKTCNHPQEFSSITFSKLINPCSETIVELKAKYNYNVQNYFRVMWNIKPAKVNCPELTSTFTFFIQRRILMKPDKASLDLFSPGPQRDFHITLDPVYIGDSNLYAQIIWLYNNSQKDIAYNCEWAEGENVIFKVFNPDAKVLAVSRHPLLIMFRPYELILYKATLLIHTSERDVSLSVTLKGKGRIESETGQSITLSKQMPVTNLFPDENFLQAELSVSHINLDPMPTHSFTKTVFFLKNNTSDHLEYDWRRTLVWGIVHLSVHPNHGTLAPGQLIACHLLVRSLRFPCRSNIAIECILRNLKDTKRYYDKKKYLGKLSRTFDACFTICNEGEINNVTHYHNPRIGLKTGAAPLNTYLCIGISIFIYSGELQDLMFPSLDVQHKLFPSRRLDTFDSLEELQIEEDESKILMQILIRALSDVFKQGNFLAAVQKNPRVLKYYEIDKYSEELLEPVLQSTNMASVICNILYKNFLSLFSLEGIPAHDEVTTKQMKRAKKLPLNNTYYKDLIFHDVNPAMSGPTADLTKSPSMSVSMAAIREYSGFLNAKDMQHGDYYGPF